MGNMKEQRPRTSERDFEIVKKRIIKQLLDLEQGRFPSERINNFNDIMIFEDKKE